MTSPILFWLALVAVIASRLADAWSSRRGIYYATSEKNKLWADKYGQFDVKKNFIFSGGLIGGVAIANLFVPYIWAIYLPIAFGSFYIAWSNVRLQKKNRVNQIGFLTVLSGIINAGANPSEIEAVFNGQILVTVSGRTWYALFPWIYEPGGVFEAKPQLVARIGELSLRKPINWFPQ